MRAVKNQDGRRIWKFDGNFVYNDSLERIYWVQGNDIFSLPQNDPHFPSGRAPAMLMGSISNGTAEAMDGRGRAFDNIFVERLWRTVKYEDVYLRGYSSLGELTVGLSDYFQFYNAERPHQSLDKQTPDEVYRNGQGGGATIPDHFKDQSVETGREKTAQRCAAVEQAETLT